MNGCTECGAPVAHEPEECEAAKVYGGDTEGACELFYLQHGEGRSLAVRLALGELSEVAYYEALAEGVELMHAVGACEV